MAGNSDDDMAPMWEARPDLHPYSIGWRMGGGEDYAIDFHDWWKNTYADAPFEDRLAYLRRHPFRPAWTRHALLLLWGESIVAYRSGDGHDFTALFEQSQDLGFPSEAETEVDLNPDLWEN